MSTVLVLLWLVVVKNLCIVYLWGGDWQQEGVTLTQHKAKLILMHISGHKCELVERGIPLTVSAVEGKQTGVFLLSLSQLPQGSF